MKELEQFLPDRTMEHDWPTLLFNLAREYLMAAKVIRSGVLILAKMVGTARKAAADLTSQLVGHLLTAEVRADLERMLVVNAGLGMTRLEWLVSPARDASATSVKTAIDKLTWLRAIDAHQMDVSVLPKERRRFLAQVARRSTNQGLERRKERKFPILLAFVAQAAVNQLDEVVALFDQAVSARESRAKSKTDEALVERAMKGEARRLVTEMILPVLADPSIADDEVGGMLRERIGMQRLREITSDVGKPLPRDHGLLSELESSYTYLRQFTPNVLAAIDFPGGPGTGEPMEAVAMLKEMNRLSDRKVPAGAPTGFVSAKYADYPAKARKSGQDTTYRHFWELCDLVPARRAALGGRLRAGLAPLRRPGHLPVHARAVGAAARRVLPPGGQAATRGPGAGAGQGGTARCFGGVGEDPGRRRSR